MGEVIEGDKSEIVENYARIFVGMLPKHCNEEELSTLCESFGVIKKTYLVRSKSGKSKCCGFVTFDNEESGRECIKELHDKTPEVSVYS